MRIVVDIGHPAHVHFFKHFIWEMEKRGHIILITTREKDITCELLDDYGFKYKNLGGYKKSLFMKLINLFIVLIKMLKIMKDFKPDIFMGIASSRAAHVSFLLRKKCYVFDDTENSLLEILLYLPFVTKVLTPRSFNLDLGKKQIRYNGYHELAYLHPNRFKPDSSILSKLGVKVNDKFIIMRFVSWTASHDLGHQGITQNNKIYAVRQLEKYGNIFITSETELPVELEQYRIRIPPHQIHHVLYYATLLYGESSTMASECAILGTPAIYLDNVGRGYTDEQETRYGLIFNFSESKQDQIQSIEKGVEILKKEDIKRKWNNKRNQILKDNIDVTEYMVSFIESEE